MGNGWLRVVIYMEHGVSMEREFWNADDADLAD